MVGGVIFNFIGEEVAAHFSRLTPRRLSDIAIL
jgi:hypothetical protein